MSDALLRTLLGAQLGLTPGAAIPTDYGYPSAYVKVSSTDAVARVQSALVAKGFHAESPSARAEELPAVLRLVSRLNLILGTTLLLFCLGLGLSLGGTWSSLRRWDVGVLASLGWSRRRIMGSYMAEIMLVGALAAAASIALGCAGSAALGLLLEGRTVLGARFVHGVALPPVGWLAAVVIGMPLALVIGSAPRVLRLASLPPDLALRRQG